MAFMEFHPRDHHWLFGGVYEVLERNKGRYVLKLDDTSEKFIGRLLVQFHRYQGMRGRAFRLEPNYESMTVSEIFPEVYSGESFPGYEKIAHDFRAIESAINMGRKDWKAALESIKGIYLITDRKNGKQYVGSAYGDSGIWCAGPATSELATAGTTRWSN